MKDIATGSIEKMFFEQVPREPRLSDKVADRLLETIISRDLRPGDRLPSERELGEQFGVSRTVVREAVRVLSAKGVIEARSGSGLRVASVGPSAVSESMGLYLRGNTIGFLKVHEVRTMLETQTAGLAAERHLDADALALTAACERMEACAADVGNAALLDVEFHREIATATHNELNLLLLDSIGNALVTIRQDSLAVPGATSETLGHHRRILERILARDQAGARQAMAAHLDQVKKIWESRGRRPEL